MSVGCVTIGVQRSDGDIRLLTTINNNDDELSAEAFAQLIDHTVNVYQMLDIDAQVYLRQDSPDYFDPDEHTRFYRSQNSDNHIDLDEGEAVVDGKVVSHA